MTLLQPPFEPAILLRNSRRIARELRTSAGLKDIRVAILGGATSQEIATFLDLFLLDKGFAPSIWQSEYGKFWEDAVLHPRTIAEYAPDLVYVHTGIRNVQTWPETDASETEMRELAAGEISRLAQVWDSVNEHSPCTILQNNFDFPDLRLLGNLESQSLGGATQFVLELNRQLATEVKSRPYVLINDIHYLSAQVGLNRWHDFGRWFSYKLPNSVEGSVTSAFNLAALTAARYGLSKKVMVLDLDNTLWGGVIGDDGVDRIVIGRETAQAEAFSSFQSYCLALKRRGVVLAVCSKNNHEIAAKGLEHPDSVLNMQDIACFKANWEPKHENLKEIARELNLGLESFVFVDDNPAERALVSAQLPMVAVPNIGSDVSGYARIIDRHHYFEPIVISSEDLKRGDQYKANAERSKVAATFADYDEYLQSLEMKAEIEAFAPTYLDRITQLTNKTNQFNLTTRRYSSAEIAKIADDPDYVTLYVRLADRFGDHGLISVVIGRREGDELHLNLWLMSCRVLKRDVELMVLDELAASAQNLGISRLRGHYIRTPKNDMVSEHYKSLGFECLASDPAESCWVLSLENYRTKNRNIQINESGRSTRPVAASVS